MLSVYLAYCLAVEYFAFVFRKHNLTVIYVVTMASLCILLFIIHDGKPVRFFTVKLNKSRGKKYFVFIILYENKNLVCFIITSKRLTVFNGGFYVCDLYILIFFIVICCQRCFMFDSKVSIKIYLCNLIF